VVKLVNTVAKIVHEACIDNYGAPNKNIGDAFLVIMYVHVCLCGRGVRVYAYMHHNVCMYICVFACKYARVYVCVYIRR
jgi:hypothetical protein